MQLDTSESLYENLLNLPGMESNSEDSLNLSQIRENFDFREPLLSLDEDEDEKLYFISNENSEKNFNFRYNRNRKKKDRAKKE